MIDPGMIAPKGAHADHGDVDARDCHWELRT
jgi:hypothetical protein